MLCFHRISYGNVFISININYAVQLSVYHMTFQMLAIIQSACDSLLKTGREPIFERP
jgi:hypothetical protein